MRLKTDTKIGTMIIARAALNGIARFRIYTLPTRQHPVMAYLIMTAEHRETCPEVSPFEADFRSDYRFG